MVNKNKKTGDLPWTLYTFVISLFFVSGFSSLIYQVIWTRLLVFVFGSTTFASSTVLAVFMGGLAFGSFLAAKFSERIRHPFLWYGILEGLIGLWAVFAPLLFDAAIPLYRAAWQEFHLSVLPFSLLRFAIAALILLPPTTCMGATLPLLAKFSAVSLSSISNRVGTLYAVNTLGAVSGAMLAGFVLLPALGLNMTTFLAVVSNLLICALVWWHHMHYPVSSPINPSSFAKLTDKSSVASASPAPSWTILLTIIAFGVSGAVAMIYEVAWTRTLLMVIGSSTYAFTIMLSSFLLGIFLGSFIFARFSDNLKQPLAWFAGLQLLLSLAGLFSVHMFNYLPYLNLVTNASFAQSPAVALSVRFLLASLVLMPLSICLGGTFPLVVKACTSSLVGVGRSVGTLYSANTLGAIIGAFLAGFVLVPLLGGERTLLFALLTNFVLGTILLFLVPTVRVSIKIATGLTAVYGLAWCLNSPAVFDRVVLMSAQQQRRNLSFQTGFSLSSFASYKEWRDMLHKTSKSLFWEDGTCSSVGVLFYPASRQRSLLTNGHVDASDGSDMSTQVLLGVYPVLFKPEAKSAAIIGWGSGVTIGAATLFPIRSIVGIEIERAVLEAAKFFDHVNLKPELDPRVQIELNDGRNYLLASNQNFDLIVSEPSNPWQSGVCNLFTKEYFSICRQRLTEDGIFALWLQLSEISTKDLLSVLSALKSAYHYIVPLQSEEKNMVVLASQHPLTIDYLQGSKLIRQASIAEQLKRAGITSFDDVLARIISCPEAISQMAANVIPNNDDLNQLEWNVSKTYENNLYGSENKIFLEHNTGKPWQIVKWESIDKGEKTKIMSHVAAIAVTLKCPLRALQWSQESLRIRKNPEAFRIAGIAHIELGQSSLGMKLLDEALCIDPHHVETLQTRGLLRLSQGNTEAAKKDFLYVLALEPNNLAASYHMAQAYYSALLPPPKNTTAITDHHISKKAIAALVLKYLGNLPANKSFVAEHHDTLLLAGIAYQQIGNLEKAEVSLRQYLHRQPDSLIAWRTLAAIFNALGKTAESASCLEQSFIVSRKLSQALVERAKNFLALRQESKAHKALQTAIQLCPTNEQATDMLHSLINHSQQPQKVLSGSHPIKE